MTFPANQAALDKIAADAAGQFAQFLTDDGLADGDPAMNGGTAEAVYISGPKAVYTLGVSMVNDEAGLLGDQLGAVTPTGTVTMQLIDGSVSPEFMRKEYFSITQNNHLQLYFDGPAAFIAGGENFTARIDCIEWFGGPLVIPAGHRLEIAHDQDLSALEQFVFHATGISL